MTMRLPIRLAVFEAAHRDTTVTGSVPLSRMRRLVEMAGLQPYEASATLRLYRREDKRAWLEGTLSAVLTLQCQRCLAPFEYPIVRQFELVLVQSDLEAARLQAQAEPLWVEDGWVYVEALLEDELLLSLPLAARHAAVGDCDPSVVAPLGGYSVVPAEDQPAVGPSQGTDRK